MSTLTRVWARRHPFDLDESLADPYEQSRRARLGLPPAQWCGECGLPGSPGDARHTALTADDLRQAWRAADAARLGERLEPA